MKKYTVRYLLENATENRSDKYGEFYLIDGHRIHLQSIWSYRGGMDSHLVSVFVDGEMIATRCKRELGIRKALEALNAVE